MKLFLSLLLAGTLGLALAARAEDEPAKPKTDKSQGAILELDAKERTMAIGKDPATKVVYKVAPDAAIKTHEKETAAFEDLKVGDAYNFWFTTEADGTKLVNRMTQKGAPPKKAEEKPKE